MKETAVLVGNDINNATETYTWSKLLEGLLEYARIKKLNMENKPFPLLYEEIYLKSAQKYNTPEYRIKAFIALNTRKLKPNILHEKILELDLKHIMTTNYDLSFERQGGLTEKSCPNKGFVRENLYSVFRYHKSNSQKIWHIHGSQTSPKSITLGYEHYSGYLQAMRSYVATGTGENYKKRDFLPLAKRIRENSVNHESWIDLFFTHDIHIFGLNLDFVEIHLWWLLTYRARVIVQQRYKVTNRIFYYYPKDYKVSDRHKLEMLQINQVEPVAVNGYENKIRYYTTIIEKIRRFKGNI